MAAGSTQEEPYGKANSIEVGGATIPIPDVVSAVQRSLALKMRGLGNDAQKLGRDCLKGGATLEPFVNDNAYLVQSKRQMLQFNLQRLLGAIAAYDTLLETFAPLRQEIVASARFRTSDPADGFIKSVATRVLLTLNRTAKDVDTTRSIAERIARNIA